MGLGWSQMGVGARWEGWGQTGQSPGWGAGVGPGRNRGQMGAKWRPMAEARHEQGPNRVQGCRVRLEGVWRVGLDSSSGQMRVWGGARQGLEDRCGLGGPNGGPDQELGDLTGAGPLIW